MLRICCLSLLMLLAVLSPARATELRVMTLGDSIVGGVEGNFRTPLKKLLEADGYAVRYVGVLRDNDGNLHEGHGGWTPAQVRLVLGSTYRAEVYIVYAGLNGLSEASLAPGPDGPGGDGGYGPHVAAMRGILDAIFERQPSSQVVLAQIGHTRDAASVANILISQFNRQLAAMVAAYGHAGQLLLVDAERVYGYAPENFVDGAHPNQRGYDALALALYPAVRQAAAASAPFPWETVGLAVAAVLALGLLVARWRRRILA